MIIGMVGLFALCVFAVVVCVIGASAQRDASTPSQSQVRARRPQGVA